VKGLALPSGHGVVLVTEMYNLIQSEALVALSGPRDRDIQSEALVALSGPLWPKDIDSKPCRGAHAFSHGSYTDGLDPPSCNFFF
jgi:hypothetical protein